MSIGQWRGVASWTFTHGHQSSFKLVTLYKSFLVTIDKNDKHESNLTDFLKTLGLRLLNVEVTLQKESFSSFALFSTMSSNKFGRDNNGMDRLQASQLSVSSSTETMSTTVQTSPNQSTNSLTFPNSDLYDQNHNPLPVDPISTIYHEVRNYFLCSYFPNALCHLQWVQFCI